MLNNKSTDEKLLKGGALFNFSEEALIELSNGRGSEIEERSYISQHMSRSLKSVVSAAYTDSSLVNHTRISPHCSSPRLNSIDTITIHMVWGQCTVEALGAIFADPTRYASSNYGVGLDGRIGLYCHERDRSWCSSSPSNDNRAITIETASDTVYPYAVTSKAYEALIKLCADICKRNGKTKMVWCGSLAKTNARTFASNEMRMTLHKWFAATECPGQYLESRMQNIADRVNAILGVKNGWKKENGKWYYYVDGKKKIGWLKDNNKWYYLDETGARKTGWVKVKSKWYYLGTDGVMVTGWKKINYKWYYFKETGTEGAMTTGWFTDKDGKHYFDENGVLLSGWQTINGKKYYFKGVSKGIMQTGWYKGSKKWYYFNAKGVYSEKVTSKYQPFAVKATRDPVLPIRSTASAKGNKQGEIKKGAKVYIVYTKKSEGGTWGLLTDYYVKKDGWIAMKYAKEVK